MLATTSPYSQYFDLDGSPLDAGYIYFGIENQNPEISPISVYWDADGTQPVAQPVRTLNGYHVRSGSPALVYASADYSITVKNQRGVTIYYAPSSVSFSNGSAIEAQISELRADLASTSDATKGDALIGVKRDATGSVARNQHDKNQDSLSIQDMGISTANTPTQNSTALQHAITEALAAGFSELWIDDTYIFDGDVTIPERSLIQFRGPGRVDNLYRKDVASGFASRFVPPNEINPELQLKALRRTATPVVAIMGDSISTEGPDTYAHCASMWSVIKERLQSQNPDKTFTFYNRAIGGQTWLHANTVPTTFPAWYTVTATPWLDYVQALVPDVVFLAYGMNDSNGFNAGAVDAVVQKILLWAKIPDIIFVTNPVPALTTLYPDGAGFGFVGDVFQEGRDFAAGWVRTYAKQKGYGLLDINRMMVAARDGYDTLSGALKTVETVTASAYTAVVPAKDFCFTGTCTGTWTEGRVLKVKCGLGSLDFIFILKTGGNFDIRGSTVTVGTYKTVLPGIAIPATPFTLEVSVYGDVCRVILNPATAPVVIAEFQTIRHGGQHSPQIEWQDSAGNGPFSSITYLAASNKDLKYRQIASDSDIWGLSDITPDIKPGYGGNGINHYSARGVELVVRPVVEATNFCATRPVLDEIDLVLGTNTTAITAFAKAERIGRMVRLTGTIVNAVTTPGNGDTIFTVPAGFRPRRDGIRFGVVGGPLFQHVSAGVFKCEVGPIGVLFPLDTITYFVD